ncbi:MAG: N-acetylneuraminate synthase [Candidatus Margulisbacteria bacterium GWF2_35_9]|nr:MAG: N-acetylneuraminate synthase [Candidatus Margulisbacteria bacterium GWF2_35_9]
MKNNIYIIAEVGINHNGDVETAKQMIKVASECGVDCVKFQTFKADEFVSDPNQTYTYKSQGKEVTESMLAMFKRYEFKDSDWNEIIDCCDQHDITFCSTAQNIKDLDYLLSITELPFIKVGSDDLTNLKLMNYYASKQKPMIISTGMAYASEIEDAINEIKKTGNDDITVLHCVSSYPAEAKEVNLEKIPAIRKAFGVDVGFSDHTIGSAAAVGAVCFGATVIEKHFTLDHNMPGPDHWFSMEPQDLKKYTEDIRFIEKAIGSSVLEPTDKEKNMRSIMQRKIVVGRDMNAGEIIMESDIDFKRAPSGIEPKHQDFILGRQLKRAIKKGDPVKLEDFI